MSTTISTVVPFAPRAGDTASVTRSRRPCEQCSAPGTAKESPGPHAQGVAARGRGRRSLSAPGVQPRPRFARLRDTWWTRIGQAPRTVRAHEFGHLIGCYDEYKVGPEVLAKVGADGPSYKDPKDVELLSMLPEAQVRFLASPGAYLAPGQYRAVLLFESVIPEQPGTRLPKRQGLGPMRPPAQPVVAHAVASGQLAMELGI